MPAKTETRIPIAAQVTDNTAAHIVTLRKFLKIHIAETAGKMTSAEIKREPTRFIASTITTAMIIANIKL